MEGSNKFKKQPRKTDDKHKAQNKMLHVKSNTWVFIIDENKPKSSIQSLLDFLKVQLFGTYVIYVCKRKLYKDILKIPI